jgi:Holliday junction DNA helicase RuvB
MSLYDELMAEYGGDGVLPPRRKSKPPSLSAFMPVKLPPVKFADSSVALLTPKTFDEYVGQEHAKRLVKVMMDAAAIEQRPLPNMMITGTAGLGKTSLARLILEGEAYKFTDGNTLNAGVSDLSGYLIVDEIHNTKSEVCDALNLLIDDGTVRIMACTTNPGMLPGPFRTRFRTINLLPYSVEDLVQIMQNVLERRGDLIVPYVLLEKIAQRGRRTPRVTLQYLSLIMDMMVVNEQYTLTNELLEEAFDAIGVDELGLLEIDRRYLAAFPSDDRAVGLQYLCAVIACDKETIEQEIEPYLLSLKLIDRTSKGRIKISEDRLLEGLFS